MKNPIKENPFAFFVLGMTVVLIILTIVYFRIDYLIGVFDKMCYYQYDLNSTCSCFTSKQYIPSDLINISEIIRVNP